MTTITDDLRAAMTAAPMYALPDIHRAIYAAYRDNQITDDELAALDAAYVARKTVAVVTQPAQRRHGGSRPRTDASMGRRRQWATSGRLPPQMTHQYTLAEQAVLATIAAETVRRGDCRICHAHIAALAGVSRSTVRATIRRARDLGHVTVEERRLSAYRNDPSIVRIVAPEWMVWLRLGRHRDRVGGVISLARTITILDAGRTNRPAREGRRATEPETRRSRSANLAAG